MKSIHDLIVDELFVNKSIAAFIYLINIGREVDFSTWRKGYVGSNMK